MKVFLIDPGCYGTSGTIVLAVTEERAKELYLESNPTAKEYVLSCKELLDRSDVEFCCPDFRW